MADYPLNTTGSTGTTWLHWNDATAATTTSVTIWNTWIDTGTGNGVTVTGELAEELAEEVEQHAEQRREQRRVACSRAKALLLELLAEEQRTEYEQHGHFHVHTRNGERSYRLAPGRSPVRVKGEDGITWEYCIHAAFGYPDEDVALTQKMLLEADEDAFLETANAYMAAS